MNIPDTFPPGKRPPVDARSETTTRKEGAMTAIRSIRRLEAADIPVMPLHTIETLLDDPHLEDVGLFEVMEHPTEGPVRIVGCPSTWSAHEPANRHHAPALGEHTAQILAEAGLSEAEIAAAAGTPVPAG